MLCWFCFLVTSLTGAKDKQKKKGVPRVAPTDNFYCKGFSQNSETTQTCGSKTAHRYEFNCCYLCKPCHALITSPGWINVFRCSCHPYLQGNGAEIQSTFTPLFLSCIHNASCVYSTTKTMFVAIIFLHTTQSWKNKINWFWTLWTWESSKI